jgi:hypothetical protein
LGSELVGHQYVRRKALLLEQSAYELRSHSGVAPPLHEKIENLAFVIDRSPEPEPSAADQNRHFIEMPNARWAEDVGGEVPWRTTARTSTPIV